MIKLRLYVENIAGDWIGWVDGFPGAYCHGGSTDEAARSASRGMADYSNWLQTHGWESREDEERSTAYGQDAEIVSVADGVTWAAEEARHVTATDEAPVGDDAFNHLLRLLAWSREDTIETAAVTPPHEWDLAPFGGRSIRLLMERLADAEASMLSRAGGTFVIEPHADPLVRLSRTRAAFVAGAQTLFDAGASGNPRSRGGRWPIAKALRMAIWHDRYVSAQIAARSDPAVLMRTFLGRGAVVRGGSEVVAARASHRESHENTLAVSHARSGENTYYY